MNQLAMWLGYVVMGAGGLLFAAALALFALERAWKAMKRRETWRVVSVAIREWCENHPEKAEKAREREQ